MASTSTTTQPNETRPEFSLTEQLRQDIVARNLVPQQRLVEADVAAGHGATRGEVRLALNRLITEGLDERIPSRGARVRKVTLQEAREITVVRAAVESLCARKAAEKITDTLAAELREIGQQMPL